MELISFMQSKKIGGLEENELREVLDGIHGNIDIKKSGQGMIMLTNNTIIKCVSNYYRNPYTDLEQKIKTNNLALRCFYVRGALGVTSTSTFQCVDCHLLCLERLKINLLVRNYVVK